MIHCEYFFLQTWVKKLNEQNVYPFPKQLGPPLSPCIEDPGKWSVSKMSIKISRPSDYTYDGCIEQCFNHEILRRCKCYLPHFLIKDDCGRKQPANDGDYEHDLGRD